MRIHFLGTGSASVTAERDNTSILVEAGANLILLDCGGNPAGKILRLGYDPCALDAIFLTHLHIDHCYGLPALLFHLFLQKRMRPLPVFFPEEEMDLLNQQLLSHGIGEDVRTYQLEKSAVGIVQETMIWETEHAAVYSGIARHSRATRAYRIIEKRTGRRMVFSGDTHPVNEMIALSRNVDVLIHEATYLESHAALATEYGHSTARQAGQIAENARAASLALVHFECPPGSSIQQYRNEAASEFRGTIYTPDDMTGIVL